MKINPISDNILPVLGGYNFRDIGGLKNREGKSIKKRKLIRADELNRLTDTDLELLASIPIVSIVDFRDNHEIERSLDQKPPSLKQSYTCSIISGNLYTIQKEEINEYTKEAGEEIMSKMYNLFITHPECQKKYRQFFSILQNETDIPLLFHCTAGKDRTGVAAALILSALNVDFNTIMEDYLFSNVCLEEKYGKVKAENPFLKSLFEANPHYLQTAFDTIANHYGSTEYFLKQILGVNLQVMQNLYLE